jgi:hypothetical protein
MSALKHFNTGSIRQGFIIDEVSVHCRVMGLCSLKDINGAYPCETFHKKQLNIVLCSIWLLVSM